MIELLNRQRWITINELFSARVDYIENFYNPARRHSSLNYLTPIEFLVPRDEVQKYIAEISMDQSEDWK